MRFELVYPKFAPSQFIFIQDLIKGYWQIILIQMQDPKWTSKLTAAPGSPGFSPLVSIGSSDFSVSDGCHNLMLLCTFTSTDIPQGCAVWTLLGRVNSQSQKVSHEVKIVNLLRTPPITGEKDRSHPDISNADHEETGMCLLVVGKTLPRIHA